MQVAAGRAAARLRVAPRPRPPAVMEGWWTPGRGRVLLATKGSLSTLIIDASDPKELVVYCFSLC